jgi:hypothetical protein
LGNHIPLLPRLKNKNMKNFKYEMSLQKVFLSARKNIKGCEILFLKMIQFFLLFIVTAENTYE